MAEGDLPVHRRDVVPGHEVVGRVVGVGERVRGFVEGERVGVAWLRRTCGECRFCRRGDENLCPRSRYTGWDADGGYAEYTTVPAAFAYRLPEGYTNAEPPRCCAPASSATTRYDGPTSRRAAVSGSTASGGAPTWPRRSRWRREPRCM